MKVPGQLPCELGVVSATVDESDGRDWLVASEVKRTWKDSQSERSGGQRPREAREQRVPGGVV